MQACLSNIQKTSKSSHANFRSARPRGTKFVPQDCQDPLGPIVLFSTRPSPGGRVLGRAATAVRQLYGSLKTLRAAYYCWWSRTQRMGPRAADLLLFIAASLAYACLPSIASASFQQGRATFYGNGDGFTLNDGSCACHKQDVKSTWLNSPCGKGMCFDYIGTLCAVVVAAAAEPSCM